MKQDCICQHCGKTFCVWFTPSGTVIWAVCEPCYATNQKHQQERESPTAWRERALAVGNV